LVGEPQSSSREWRWRPPLVPPVYSMCQRLARARTMKRGVVSGAGAGDVRW